LEPKIILVIVKLRGTKQKRLNIYIFASIKYVVMNTVKDLRIEQLEQAASMLKAIAHPMRIAILNFLEDGNRMTVTEIHEKLEIEQSTTSHHLGILKDKGVLASKREGKNTFYFLKNDSLAKIMECLNKCTT
jgi:DNA-binding transcriptional ArsR family regulator